MISIARLAPTDVDSVVSRVAARLGANAEMSSLVNPEFDQRGLADALGAATSSTWVAREAEGVLAGHLYGAVLESAAHGRGAWVGPDGASFDSVDVLADLYATAGQAWIDDGALEHYVWVFDDPSLTEAWLDLGFSRVHRRGAMFLNDVVRRPLPAGYSVRRATIDDLDAALDLTREIDRAQANGPSFSINLDTRDERDDVAESLQDPDNHYYFVEVAGTGVAQCVTFPLPARRGSFDATLHVSAVAVRPEHRDRGVATALIDEALEDARRAGFRVAETNWRVTNRRAHRFWTGYGFAPTYVRLHRTIGAG